jgi:hypothetical protein
MHCRGPGGETLHCRRTPPRPRSTRPFLRRVGRSDGPGTSRQTDRPSQARCARSPALAHRALQPGAVRPGSCPARGRPGTVLNRAIPAPRERDAAWRDDIGSAPVSSRVRMPGIGDGNGSNLAKGLPAGRRRGRGVNGAAGREHGSRSGRPTLPQARAARSEGLGISRPVDRAVSSQAAIACSTSATASCGVGPCAAQQGRSGTTAIHTSSSSLQYTSIG